MLLKSILLLLFLIANPVSPSSGGCYTYLIPETPVSYGCSESRTFLGSALNLQTPSKELSISLTITPTLPCALPQDFNFFLLLVFPASLSYAPRAVARMTYYGSEGKIAFRSEDANGISATQHITVANFWNNPMNLYVTINLASGSFSFSGGGTFETTSNIFSASVSYGSDWVFDSRTQIDYCADSAYGNMGCTVQNLKVAYSYYSQPSFLDLTNSVNIIGDYKMQDGSGASPTNSQGTLGSALPFASSPAWDPDTGLEFSVPSQYIQLPGFIPSSSDLTVITSLGFGLYLQIDRAPTADFYILYYWLAQMSRVIFGLVLTPSMKLKTQIDDVVVEGSLTLNVGEWYWIYVSYIYTKGGLGLSQVYVNGQDISLTAYATGAQGPSKLSALDFAQLGSGFPGKIRRLQVYSPAAYKLNEKPCDSTTCEIDMGFDTPTKCIRPVCSTPGYYPSLGTCESCPTRCTTCTDPTSCHSCIVGYYLDGTTCKRCPMHCTSCTDAQTCQSCSSGYGIFNNLCMICPIGTYLDSSTSKFCQRLSSTLQNTLTNSQLTNSAATQVANVLSKGSSVSLSAMIGGKIFSQIKYLDISYSGELQVALLTWLTSFVSLGLTPNIPDSIIEKIPERHVPPVFEKYDIVSSFAVNFWENLGVIIFASILCMLFKGLEITFGGRKALFSRKLRVMVQNFLIAVLFGVYGDLIMFALLEYRSLVFGWNLSLLSFIISVILIALMFFTFWYQTRLLLNYQRIKKYHPENLAKFKAANEGSQILFKDFKDYSLAPQLVFFFLSGRDIIFSFMLATLVEYPLAQTLILTGLDCLMIAYLFIKKPYESTFDFIQQLFFEFIGLSVNIAVLVNAILDKGKYETIQARKNIGKLVILANLIFNFVTAIFMFIVIGQSLLGFYREHQEKRERKFRATNLQNKLQRSPPAPLEESLQKSKLLTSQQSFINNNIETISFQQESFDLGVLPLQIQSTTHLRRRIKKNPQRRFQNPVKETQVPPLDLNQRAQRRVLPPSNQNPLPIGVLIASSPAQNQADDRMSRHQRVQQQRTQPRSQKFYN